MRAVAASANSKISLMPVTPVEMQAIEHAAFARGIRADDLMDQAGLGMADVISQFFPTPGHAHLVCGKGHNAGDILVAGKYLRRRGWLVSIELIFPADELAALTKIKLAELDVTDSAPSHLYKSGPFVILDGLLGIGSTGCPREPIATAIQRINRFRIERHAFVFAADLPSGLDGLTGIPSSICVQADCTVTIAIIKTGLLADAATNHVGRLAVVPLDELQPPSSTDAHLLTPDFLRPLLPPRNFNTHKGTWGRVAIVAGSPQYLGAARICSAAAVSAGAGLVTLYTTSETAALLRGWCVPEVMIKSVSDLSEVTGERLDALAIGPGLGNEHDPAILKLIREIPSPTVIDADAINALARNPDSMNTVKGPRLLTPHPVEMERLVPGSLQQDRRTIAENFVRHHHPVTLLLKGARTIIAQSGSPSRFNTTGDPGMGSGGMGDALTGVCAALMARGLSPFDAASIGAWVCGRASETFVFGKNGSSEALTASRVIDSLGAGFQALRNTHSY